MMRRPGWICGTVLVGALALSTGSARGEVSMDIASDSTFRIIILGTTEGPDPWARIWVPHRDIDPGRILNPDGANRGDGRPDVTVPGSGAEIVVWAYRAGLDHDIAIAEWEGTTWGPTRFLTAATSDELDPRVLVTPDGMVHVVWWVRQTKSLYLVTKPAHSDLWGLPITLTTPLGGARPSLAYWEGSLHMAYDRPAFLPNVRKEVLVTRRVSETEFQHVVVAQTPSDAPLDATLHTLGDLVWVDWKHTGTDFGYSIMAPDGSWGPAFTIPWDSSWWIGEEEARLAVRRIVTAPPEEPATEDPQTATERERTTPPDRDSRYQLLYREQRPHR